MIVKLTVKVELLQSPISNSIVNARLAYNQNKIVYTLLRFAKNVG